MPLSPGPTNHNTDKQGIHDRPKHDLLAQNWEILHRQKDIDSAYETFRSLSNSNCPIKQ